MSLAPNYVLWAAIFFALVLIAGTIGWLVLHDTMIRVLRHLWLSDLVAAWLGYAAGYHLVFLDAYRPVLGTPWALWTLCATLGTYALLRRLPTPLRRPEVLFALAVMAWAGVLVAGQRYIAEMERDAGLLADRPQVVISPADDAAAPTLRPLWRVLLLTRVDAETIASTASVLAMLHGAAPREAALLSAYRLGRVPQVLALYRHDLAKLRTYQWLQGGLLGVVLLLWGFARVPEWEAL